MSYYRTNYVNPLAITWYRRLDVHQRIGVKESFELVCGAPFAELIRTKIFSLKEVISIFYGKLVAEGVIPPIPQTDQKGET